VLPQRLLGGYGKVVGHQALLEDVWLRFGGARVGDRKVAGPRAILDPWRISGEVLGAAMALAENPG
jgi:hypothetical protein